MGKITAAMTHEIKNVLAIIRESAGLAQDILSVVEDTAFPQKQKFSKIMDKIDNQVQRGADIVSALNSFAHLPDYEVRNEDLNSVIEQMMILSQKLSRTNGIKILIENDTMPVFMKADPLEIRMTLYSAVELLAPLLGRGSEIRIKSMKSESGSPLLGLFVKSSNLDQSIFESIESRPEWHSMIKEFRSRNTFIEAKPSINAFIMNFNRQLISD